MAWNLFPVEYSHTLVFVVVHYITANQDYSLPSGSEKCFFFFFKLSSHFSPSHFKECFFSVANVNPSHSLLQFLYKILSVHNGKKRLFEFRNMLRSSFCQKKPKWLEYTGLGFVQRKSVLCLIENALLFNSIQNFSSKCHRYLVWDFSR